MELTVKEYARAERVSEDTVRRWIAKGAVPVRRTPGGGIRIRVNADRVPIVFGLDSAKDGISPQ